MHQSPIRISGLLLFAMSAVAGAAIAGAPALAADSPWTFLLRGMASNYETKQGTSTTIFVSRWTLENPLALELGTRYRTSNSRSVELALGQTYLQGRTRVFQHVPDFSTEPITIDLVEIRSHRGHLAITNLSGAVLFHLAIAEPSELYIGPVVGWAHTSGSYAPPRGYGYAKYSYGAILGYHRHRANSRWSGGVELRHNRLTHNTKDLWRVPRQDLNLTLLSLVLKYSPSSQRATKER